jgi:hypothetical protein
MPLLNNPAVDRPDLICHLLPEALESLLASPARAYPTLTPCGIIRVKLRAVFIGVVSCVEGVDQVTRNVNHNGFPRTFGNHLFLTLETLKTRLYRRRWLSKSDFLEQVFPLGLLLIGNTG